MKCFFLIVCLFTGMQIYGQSLTIIGKDTSEIYEYVRVLAEKTKMVLLDPARRPLSEGFVLINPGEDTSRLFYDHLKVNMQEQKGKITQVCFEGRDLMAAGVFCKVYCPEWKPVINGNVNKKIVLGNELIWLKGHSYPHFELWVSAKDEIETQR